MLLPIAVFAGAPLTPPHLTSVSWRSQSL